MIYPNTLLFLLRLKRWVYWLFEIPHVSYFDPIPTILKQWGLVYSHIQRLLYQTKEEIMGNGTTMPNVFTLGLRKAEGYCRHPSVCLSVRPLHMIIQ